MEQFQEYVPVIALAMALITGGILGTVVTWLIRKCVELFGVEAKVVAAFISGGIGLAAGYHVYGIPQSFYSAFVAVVGSILAAQAVYKYLGFGALKTKGE